jgi:Na+/H+ antiporter NhaC
LDPLPSGPLSREDFKLTNLPEREGKGDPLVFRGGLWGAFLPFAFFLIGVVSLGLSGAPAETGFWPVLLAALMMGLLLSRDRQIYSETIISGMSRPLVMIMVMAWMLAGVLGTLLAESGLVQALVWAASSAGVSGGGYVVGSFLIASIVSTATGTSLGTILVCVPMLYPGGGALGADPVMLMGGIIGGATFGDNVSPVSDTTIASANTQGADMGGVVRSRMRYALPAAFLALLVYGFLGGGGAPAAGTALTADVGPGGLIMLAIPALVIVLLIRRRHLIEGLMMGILAAAVLGMATGQLAWSQIFYVDREAFSAGGLILDGMQRGVGVSVFTILLMGLVAGLEEAGIMKRLVDAATRGAKSAAQAEWRIFGTISAAVLLTTHSAVAILAVGELTRDAGESFGLSANRRANLLDVTVCTYPFLLPFFIPTILAASTTVGYEAFDMPRLSAWSIGLHNAHSWALLVVILLAIGTGWGRGPTESRTSASSE